jgi:hypothetical protein
MHQPDNVSRFQDLEVLVIIVGRIIEMIYLGIPGPRQNPLIIMIFVMIDCHLLLFRSLWVGLDMRVQQPPAVGRGFDGDQGAVGNFERVFREF